jgi:hypothetical protein
LYLMRYKRKTNTVVEGVSKKGEISPQGVVAHTEDWEGRLAATVGSAAIRYVRDPDGRIRPMTMQEMIDRGYFIVARGPTGVRTIREGIR